MNKIEAFVKSIVNVDELSLIEFDYAGIVLTMVGIELHKRLKTGQKVLLGVKSTQISLAKNFSGELSFSNKIEAKIKKIEKGKILSSVVLQKDEAFFEALILSEQLKKMDLNENDNATILIKSTEVSILEFL